MNNVLYDPIPPTTRIITFILLVVILANWYLLVSSSLSSTQVRSFQEIHVQTVYQVFQVALREAHAPGKLHSRCVQENSVPKHLQHHSNPMASVN